MLMERDHVLSLLIPAGGAHRSRRRHVSGRSRWTVSPFPGVIKAIDDKTNA